MSEMDNNNVQIWECGTENANDVIATLSGTTLTISGKGKMKDYKWYYGLRNPPPWQGQIITKVVINKGIANIGSKYFQNCYGLTSIVIPDTVTEINEEAFSQCTGLTSVTIPNRVTRIGREAFLGCSSLTSITIPRNVTHIGSGAFSQCAKLTSFFNLCFAPQIIDNYLGLFGYCTFIEGQRITNFVVSQAILYVPISILNVYKNAPVWKDSFKSILPISEEEMIKENTSEQKVLMRGLKGNPKHVADFMSLFNQRDELKYLTHDFDENGNFDYESFLSQIKKVCTENLGQLEIPKTLIDLLNQFAFENNPKWTAFDKQFNPKEITSGLVVARMGRCEKQQATPDKAPGVCRNHQRFQTDNPH